MSGGRESPVTLQGVFLPPPPPPTTSGWVLGGGSQSTRPSAVLRRPLTLLVVVVVSGRRGVRQFSAVSACRGACVISASAVPD